MADSDYNDQDSVHEEVQTGRMDKDRYAEYFFDLYEDMHKFIDRHALLILDQHNFDDFLMFCLENMNQTAVEADLGSHQPD